MSYAPILTESQIERIRPVAKAVTIVAGQILYDPDDDTPPVYVVLSGEIGIVAIGGGHESTITNYKAGQFSGELLMIAGRRSIYRCQAVEPGTVLELQAQVLRTLIARDAELSDIFMNAFIARRLSQERRTGKCRRPRLSSFGQDAGSAGVPDSRRASLRLFRSRRRLRDPGHSQSLRSRRGGHPGRRLQ